MVEIRSNGNMNLSHKSKKRSPLWLVYLPHAITLFLVAAVSFYSGIWIGMHLTSLDPSMSDNGKSVENVGVRGNTKREIKENSENNAKNPYEAVNDDENKEDFNARVEAEVERRMAELSNNAANDKSDNTNSASASGVGGNSRLFPTTISKIATGASLIPKPEFLSSFDYGIPIPPSKREGESDPGKDDVLLLYSTEKAHPTKNPETSKLIGTHVLPHMSANDATENCGQMSVIFTESHGDANQCIAIVGNYESYHIQRWLRIKPDGSSKVTMSLPLYPVGRGLQTNGMDKFSAPSDNYALQNESMLRTYFDRLEDSLAALRPMAKSCAGEDNTVIVMVCNTGQSDLLINFVCSSEARGFGDVVKSKLLVFATDEGVLNIATALGLKVFYDEKIFEKMPEQEAGRYGDHKFTQMMYAKVVTVQLINRLGHDVLFQDVDLVWYKNPLPYFHDKQNPMYAFDILFQDDGARSLRYAPYSANTGFYYVRNNDKTKFLFRSLLYLGDMVLSMTSHQQALAALLDEHSSLTGLRVKTLDGSNFPGGYHYHRKKEKDFLKQVAKGEFVPFLFHMSWTTNRKNKLLFLKQMGLWYTNDVCEEEGGAKLAKEIAASGEQDGKKLDSMCCSADALVTCHYKDKPSIIPCKDSPSIDKNGKSFW